MPLQGEYAPSSAEWVRRSGGGVSRARAGRSGTMLRGMPVIVVTSLGYGSGKLRKNPVMRVEHDGKYAAVASKGGRARSIPAWYQQSASSTRWWRSRTATAKGDFTARELERRRARGVVGAGRGGVARTTPTTRTKTGRRDPRLRARAGELNTARVPRGGTGSPASPRRCWWRRTRSRARSAPPRWPPRSAAAWRRGGRPVDLCPVADGGEGTLRALTRGARRPSGGRARSTDPLGRPIEAEFALGGRRGHRRDGGRQRAGPRRRARARRRWPPARRDRRADRRRASRPAPAPSTSASAAAPPPTAAPGAIRAIERGGRPGRGQAGRAVRRADAVRGRRPGVRAAEGRRRRSGPAAHGAAERAGRGGCRRDPRGVPMTGAAGGLSGGLWAAFGAELVPGAAFVLDAVGLRCAHARGPRGGHRRGQARPAEPGRQGRVRGRHARPPGRRALSRDRRHARARHLRAAHPRPRHACSRPRRSAQLRGGRRGRLAAVL